MFDVIHCFNPDEVESRVVRIQLEDGVQLDSDMDQVRADARKAVAEAAKVNPFRVQGIQVRILAPAGLKTGQFLRPF